MPIAGEARTAQHPLSRRSFLTSSLLTTAGATIVDAISAQVDQAAAAESGGPIVAGPGAVQSAAPDGAAPEPTASTPPTRWRVLADGRVQRSLTNGAAWDAMAIDASLRLTAGSAGAGGLVGLGPPARRPPHRISSQRCSAGHAPRYSSGSRGYTCAR